MTRNQLIAIIAGQQLAGLQMSLDGAYKVAVCLVEYLQKEKGLVLGEVVLTGNENMDGVWHTRGGKRVQVESCRFENAPWKGISSSSEESMGKVLAYYDKEGNCRMTMGWVGNCREWDLMRRENPQTGG